MNGYRKPLLVGLGIILLTMMIHARLRSTRNDRVPTDREEVVFWHFWGGADRQVVETVVERFNASQQQFFVRAIAMPGNNLDVKLFLAVTGSDPPDLINQDDPIIADWAYRGILTPLDELASPQEMKQLQPWLLPAAQRLGSYQGRLYALCNGLDTCCHGHERIAQVFPAHHTERDDVIQVDIQNEVQLLVHADLEKVKLGVTD